MIVLAKGQSLTSVVGQKVSLQGKALSSKAGPLLEREEHKYRVIGENWPMELVGKEITLVGIVTQSSGSSNSFPTATKDAHGGWSQGVGRALGLEMDDPLGILSSEPSLGTELVSSSEREQEVAIELLEFFV